MNLFYQLTKLKFDFGYLTSLLESTTFFAEYTSPKEPLPSFFISIYFSPISTCLKFFGILLRDTPATSFKEILLE